MESGKVEKWKVGSGKWEGEKGRRGGVLGHVDVGVDVVSPILYRYIQYIDTPSTLLDTV